MRVLAYGQLARLTPPRAVGPNIAAVLRLVVPWHPCTEASYNLVSLQAAERDDNHRRDAGCAA
eukprot:3468188-Pleurochrysis_carterae.AAC.1